MPGARDFERRISSQRKYSIDLEGKTWAVCAVVESTAVIWQGNKGFWHFEDDNFANLQLIMSQS